MMLSEIRRVNDFVICDHSKCIGCYTCMAACFESARIRGKNPIPRLIVINTPSGTMPNQCRQCDDAPCVRICPVGALEFGIKNIEIHEDKCIGCKMCILACPFGAISVETEPLVNTPYYEAPLLINLLGTANGTKGVAVKCDLCEGLEGGPACVEKCPTKALVFAQAKKEDTLFVSPKAKNAVARLTI